MKRYICIINSIACVNLYSNYNKIIVSMFQFSDQNVSIVCRRNIFYISSFFSRTTETVKSNLAESLLGLRGLKYVRMKGIYPIPKYEIIKK